MSPGSFIETLPDQWNYGGLLTGTRRSPKLDGALVLGNVAALRYSTLAASRGVVGVAITAGLTRIVTRVRMMSTVAGTALNLGYGDTDVGESSAAAPTNFTRVTPRITANGSPYVVGVANVMETWSVYYEMQAGKFLCIEADIGVQTSRIEVLGIEI